MIELETLLNFAARYGWIVLWAITLTVILRIMLHPHRAPSSRIAWVVVVAVVPIAGIIAYLMVGEINTGRKYRDAQRAARETLPQATAITAPEAKATPEDLPARYQPLFRLAGSINGFNATRANTAVLAADSNASIDAMVADIDAAHSNIHVLFYIWLDDNNGLKVIDALQRAAQRGVTCRALVDGLGSRALVRSKHWQALRDAGVHTAVSRPIGSILMSPLRGRSDLRNHRKIAVIDGLITYCGSQNCADAEFRVKPKFAPWVDIMLRFEGPVVTQNQYLFAVDWISASGESLPDDILKMTPTAGAFDTNAAGAQMVAQVLGTGPGYRYSAMPEVFCATLHAAREELVISTPYFVPDEAMMHSLMSAPLRGIDTTLIVPQHNDSRFVQAAARSSYRDLLLSGVKIYEFGAGLLHAKTLTVDGELSLIGSANMDRRSLDLNFENNILLYDRATTQLIRQRQQAFLAQSKQVKPDDVADWPTRRRLWNNVASLMGPLL